MTYDDKVSLDSEDALSCRSFFAKEPLRHPVTNVYHSPYSCTSIFRYQQNALCSILGVLDILQRVISRSAWPTCTPALTHAYAHGTRPSLSALTARYTGVYVCIYIYISIYIYTYIQLYTYIYICMHIHIYTYIYIYLYIYIYICIFIYISICMYVRMYIIINRPLYKSIFGTLQHKATHCNTLHHTATHGISLQPQHTTLIINCNHPLYRNICVHIFLSAYICTHIYYVCIYIHTYFIIYIYIDTSILQRG